MQRAHELFNVPQAVAHESLLTFLGERADEGGLTVLHGTNPGRNSAILSDVAERLDARPGLVWSMYENDDGDALLAGVYRQVAGRELSAKGIGRAYAVIRLLEEVADFVLVIDGLQTIQGPDGTLLHFGLQLLVEFFAQRARRAHLFATGEFSIPVEGPSVFQDAISSEPPLKRPRERAPHDVSSEDEKAAWIAEFHTRVEENNISMAMSLYQEVLLPRLLEDGDVARAERLVRTLLVHLSPDARADRLSSILTLASLLKAQGQPAAQMTALTQALDLVDEISEADAEPVAAIHVRILHDQAESAVIRGELEQASDWLDVAGRHIQAHLSTRAHPADWPRAQDVAENAVMKQYVTLLRTGSLPQGVLTYSGTSRGRAVLWTIEALIAVGEVARANQLITEVLFSSQPAEDRWAALLRVVCEFAHSSGAPTSDESVARSPDALGNLERAAREEGDIMLLSRVLILTANHRRRQNFTEALRYQEEAERLARRHGFDRDLAAAWLVGSRIHADSQTPRSSHVDGESTALLAAWRMNDDAHRWARSVGDEMTLRAANAQQADMEARSLFTHPHGPSSQPRPVHAGSDRPHNIVSGLTAYVAIRTPTAVLCLPTEAAFAQALNVLEACSSPPIIRGEAHRLWEESLDRNARDDELLTPPVHLAILFAFCGLFDRVALVADDLTARGERAIGASLWAVARGTTSPAKARQRLRDALDHAPPELASAVAAYNLAVLENAHGRPREAIEALKRSRRFDPGFVPARDALAVFTPNEEMRARCLLHLEHAMSALDTWRRAPGHQRYPERVADVVPSWLSMAPACPADNHPYPYHVTRTGTRALLHCRRHRLRFDSSLGVLSRSPDAFPSLAPCTVFERIDTSALGFGEISVGSRRLARLIEGTDPG